MPGSLDQTEFTFLETWVPFGAMNTLSSWHPKQAKVPGMGKIAKKR